MTIAEAQATLDQELAAETDPGNSAQDVPQADLTRARDGEVSAVSDTLRGRLQELAPSRIDMVVASLDAALQAKKFANGYCKTCRDNVRVEVNDPVAAVNAFKALLEATEGKPTTAEELSQSPLVVRRVGQTKA